MDQQLIEEYWDQYGKKYLSRDIGSFYPEANVIPQYMLKHFANSDVVLDLGFGTGLWFWASFLPNLAKVDGIDLHPEALAAADRILQETAVPEGYAVVHQRLGRTLTREALKQLADKRGNFFFFDYTRPWPKGIRRSHYDLITEHGGGFGEMRSEEEVNASLRHCEEALKENGHFFFVNFQANSGCEDQSFSLNEKIFSRAVEQAGMTMIDFQTNPLPKGDRVTTSFDEMFYGYARK